MNRQPLENIPLIRGNREAQLKAALQQAISQLSIGIYSQLATKHVASREEPYHSIGRDELRKLAHDSHVAARCYFEGIGAIQPQEESP